MRLHSLFHCSKNLKRQMTISNQNSVMRRPTTFPVCVPCCHPPPILPPCCNPVVCSHAAAKIVKLQHDTKTAGGCRWWSTVSCTFKGSQSQRYVAVVWFQSLLDFISLTSCWSSVESFIIDRRLFDCFNDYSHHSISTHTLVSNCPNISASI